MILQSALIDPIRFRRDLLRWYDAHKRDLPWRSSADPYRVWISEIMLQQTRVAAVLPYYERFLARFRDVEALASAPEQELLTAWAGLGYYSRARNVQRAAQAIVQAGSFPSNYDSLRELPGIGDYTAAAVSSIAFGKRHAAVDGNVIRVLSRISAEPGEVSAAPVRARMTELADTLLSPTRPGDFNQAMMELGATICLPGEPKCLLCPVAPQCEARISGRQSDYPVKRKKAPARRIEYRLLVIERKGSLLLWQRTAASKRMAGFWELPEATQLPGARVQAVAGDFRHTIVNTIYRFEVARASISRVSADFEFVPKLNLVKIPLSSTAKKALACLAKQGSR